MKQEEVSDKNEVFENKEEEEDDDDEEEEIFSIYTQGDDLSFTKDDISSCVKVLNELYWKRNLMKCIEIKEVLDIGKKLFLPKE
jgi:hypothetical protein